MNLIKSLSIFILSGLFEIGGGYLVWQWLKEGKPLWWGLADGLILAFKPFLILLCFITVLSETKKALAKFASA